MEHRKDTPILDVLDRYYRHEINYAELVAALEPLHPPQWLVRQLEADYRQAMEPCPQYEPRP